MSGARAPSRRGVQAALVAAAILVIGAAGCQLLLPSGDDGQTSTGGTGGRTATSTSGKTSAESSSAESGSSSNASTSVSSSKSAAQSSSSSGPLCIEGQGCAVTPPTFDQCPVEPTCALVGSDDFCANYCGSISQKCDNVAKQFESPSKCCAVCQFLRAHDNLDPTNNACCRADALNADGQLTHAECTIGGPMGVDTNDNGGPPEGCGSQALHVCTVFNSVCTGKVPNEACITEDQCFARFKDLPAETYSPNASTTSPMSYVLFHTMKAAAGNLASECSTAALLACDPIAMATGTGP